MKKYIIPIVSLCLIGSLNSSCFSEAQKTDLVDYIDPTICTGSDHGQTDVAAAVPFGMVKPCPDTSPVAHSGYDYDASYITGFSQTRFSGVGCRGVGGNISILPYVSQDSIPQKRAYNKESEVATAGFYQVTLEDSIQVALTATRQVAFHQYIFPKSDYSGITVDLTTSFAGHISAQCTQQEGGYITGYLRSVNVCRLGEYGVYFALYVDKDNAHIVVDNTNIEYRFTTKDKEQVMVYCALSVVGEEEALSTLKEQEAHSFKEIHRNARQAWNDLLQVVEVESADESLKRMFYTHIYHATQSPFAVHEADGRYRGSDDKLYTVQQGAHYHGWSIWDTFRSKLPLLSMLYPERYTEIMASMASLYNQGKVDWATNTEPFLTVRTEHAVVSILEAMNKGLIDFELVASVYDKMKEEATVYLYESPDQILESSMDYWAMSEIAKKLGHQEDAKMYLEKAQAYKPLWNKKFAVMNDQSDIMHGDGLYEGTIWQYRWFVPWDMQGLIELFGGQDAFEQQLDEFFGKELFNMGNQPDIQVPYLYAYTKHPEKMNRLVNSLLTKTTNNWYGTHHKRKEPWIQKIFTDTPQGYLPEMDDDAGTMSAWYVWSALGMYPVCPGSTEMALSAPLFDRAVIHLPKGDLNIETNRTSPDQVVVNRILWNGEVLDKPFIDFNSLQQGGELTFEF